MKIVYFVPENKKLKPFEIENNSPESITALHTLATSVQTDYFLLQLKPGELTLNETSIFNWIECAKKDDAIFSYSSYIQLKNNLEETVKVLPYTTGSIRDDFNFGALALIKTECLLSFLEANQVDYNFAGWYAFRLFASREKPLHRFEKTTYSYSEIDLRKSGEKQFDYVNPQNRDRQIELEKAATFHLKEIGAHVSPPFQSLWFEDNFELEASVIIPVLNREKTIADAIQSVLKQRCNFSFNLIIVDNHSSDQTASIVASFKDERIIHHIPSRTDLGIGGCWNEGVNHPQCGRFAVQLDSDDLYLNEQTLQKIVDQFHSEKCAMVIGSYRMVNFKLEEIPPGIIDHREWTAENGTNNALRINGLGAPRAFYTPVIRDIGFPNVSYGEDYAVGLAISRSYKIGRIYDPIYLCRRWDQNTDANLSMEKTNAHNAYKDSIRTMEIEKRKKLSQSM